ncbi:MAG: VWA domain-containing protein [Blastocatellales bacterium]|jgi:Ca-activated chloride channel homolog|nr:VWA domain-containing protein [Nitrosomonas nitrosa]
MKLLKSKIAMAVFATLVTITLIFPQSGHTQQQKPQQPPQDKSKRDDDTIRIDTDLVTLTTTVVNERGRYVANLKQRDFAIYEDGVKQEVAYFNTGDKVPISLGVLFDTSGSMVDKIEGVRDAVEHFVKSVAPGDEIFLIRFSNDAELVQDFTDDRRRILRAIDRLNPRGSTALYDAILMGLQRVVDGKHNRRALMLVTDGNDTSSSVSLETTLNLARKSEVIIYALGIGHGERGSFGHSGHDRGGIIFGRQIKDEVDMNVLRQFAETTGGEAFHLENAHAGKRDLVDEAAAQVAAELKQQYLLGYYPSNTRKDGAFRQIKVELADKSLRVRTKRGYYAPRDERGR